MQLLRMQDRTADGTYPRCGRTDREITIRLLTHSGNRSNFSRILLQCSVIPPESIIEKGKPIEHNPDFARISPGLFRTLLQCSVIAPKRSNSAGLGKTKRHWVHTSLGTLILSSGSTLTIGNVQHPQSTQCLEISSASLRSNKSTAVCGGLFRNISAHEMSTNK